MRHLTGAACYERVAAVLAGSRIGYVTANVERVEQGIQGQMLVFTDDELLIVDLTAETVDGDRGSKPDLTLISRRALHKLRLSNSDEEDRWRWDSTLQPVDGWAAGAEFVAEYDGLEAPVHLPLAKRYLSGEHQQAWVRFLPSLRADLSR